MVVGWLVVLVDTLLCIDELVIDRISIIHLEGNIMPKLIVLALIPIGERILIDDQPALHVLVDVTY